MSHSRVNLNGMSTSQRDDDVFRYSGRSFTEAEIETIRRITDDPWCTTRSEIARAVCQALNWVKPDGQPKLVSCYVALDRMETDGVIWLPLPTREPVVPKAPVFTPASDPQAPIVGSRADLVSLQLSLATARADIRLYSELLQRHHYLGGGQMAGAQLRYLAYDGDRVLGALGFGAAAWKIAPRDRFIGWTAAEREAHLHLVVQNRRFLILPWVQVRGLASSLLSLAARRLPDDWHSRYAYRPALLETFVEQGRFLGTSYAAANWLHVGQTQGRGKLDRFGKGGKAIKDIWLYPLDRRFRSLLTAGRLSPTSQQATR